MAPTLTSLSPLSGPPATQITLTGTGFNASSQVACPVLVPTTLHDDGTLTAAIPGDMVGAQGTSLAIGVYVRNSDGTASAALTFTVIFPAVALQSWTDLDSVCGEIPGFRRGGRVTDDQINTWMRSVAQAISGSMMKRGLPTDPTKWPQPAAATAGPAATGVLEMINRLGAAVRLAAAIAGEWGSSEWGLAKNLERQYNREIQSLEGGAYDKLFYAAAATVDPGPLLAAGDTSRADGQPSNAFSKDQVF